MSSFAGNNLNFAITIGARDTSASTLRGVAQRYLSLAKTISKPISIPIRMARRGMAFARDFELGVRPIIAMTDRLIERGSGLEVVRKSFESLTETGGRRADMLARQMRNAASGTIRLGRAMEIANRGLASGLSFDQLVTAMDFVSKKAVTTGMSAEGAIDKVITGLARGSVLFLDDFGLVVDGIEGISRAYDKIHGAGAFDELGPAAQKAAIVNQAIKEMREQLGKIGVSGKESVFIWQGLKNQIADSVDKLVLAVAKSKSLKSTLEGFRDILSGITKHMEEGGSLWDVLLGKEDGQGGRIGGLLGIVKAAALDAGELLGRGILGGLLIGISEIPDLFSGLWTELKSILDGALAEIPTKIQAGIDWLQGRFPNVAAAHTGVVNTIGEWIFDKLRLFNKARPDGTVERGWVDAWSDAAWMLDEEPPGTWRKAFWHGVHRAWTRILGGEDPGPLKLRREDPFSPRASAVPSSKEGFLAMAVGASATATTETSGSSWADRVREAGYKILAGGDSRLGKAVDEFMKQFPPQTTEGYKFHIEKETLPLTPLGRVRREQENVLSERRLRKAESDARRQARIRAAEEVRRLRLEGYDATGKRGEIERRILDELLGRDTDDRERLKANRKALAEDQVSKAALAAAEHEQRKIQRERRQIDAAWQREHGRAGSGGSNGPMPADKSLDALVKAVKSNTEEGKRVYAALTGASSQLTQSM